MIANLTVLNVGTGNGSTAGSWWVNVSWNGTTLGNTWFEAQAPYESGQLSIPETVALGQRASGWVAFYFPFGYGISLENARTARLATLCFDEHVYGGHPEPNGGWVGGSDPMTRFESVPA